MVKAPSGNLTLDSGTILFDGCKVGPTSRAWPPAWTGRRSSGTRHWPRTFEDLGRDRLQLLRSRGRHARWPSTSDRRRLTQGAVLLDTPTAALGVVQAKNMRDTKDATAGQAVRVINFHQEWPSEAVSHV